MANQALTPAQKAQITRNRKRLEELALLADLEKQGKATRTTKTRALDNAIWRGAAPTGHAPTTKKHSYTVRESAPDTSRPRETPAPSSQQVKRPRRMPPAIVTSDDSDDNATQRPLQVKRPRVVKPPSPESAARAGGHVEGTIDTNPVQTTKSKQRAAHVAEEDDADVEEDYQHYHGVGDDDKNDDGDYSQSEDHDLVDVARSQLRSQLQNELPRIAAHNRDGQSVTPEIDIPDVELEMTSTTEVEDFDNAEPEDHDDIDTPSFQPRADLSLRQKTGKTIGGKRARARQAERPAFTAEANDSEIRSSPPVTVSQGMPSSSADLNSPNYGWPVDAHYVPLPPTLPLSLKAQPVKLQQLIRTAIRMSTGDYLFKSAYPSEKNHWKGLRATLHRCATRLDFQEYAERFENDVTFGEDIAQHLLARIANCRGEVKYNATTCVAGYYGLLPGPECAERVKDLVDNFTYIFPEEGGVMRRNKPFKHRCILRVITKSFFEGGRGEHSSLAEKHSKRFSSTFKEGTKKDELELPIPIVALAATAVHCALLEWKSGEHIKHPFHGDTYQPIYEHHVKVLEDIRNEGGKYHRLMADLYQTVSRGKNPAANVDTAALVDLDAMDE
ncbi:hypothetical protein BC835DRAFT_1421041 [Cytidiella melzeri]|nr:hypothetical protein BC835DRAFT_1421041 [Cytidiella melzeri]